MSTLDRLIEVGQRLDELSDDLPELADLSEEIGKIVDLWPQPQPREVGEVPEYLREIQQVVERQAEQILYHRYGGNQVNSAYINVSIPNHAAMYQSMAQAATIDPKAAMKAVGIV